MKHMYIIYHLKDNLVATVKYGEDETDYVDHVKEGEWIVIYESKCYPGQVTEIGENVNVMRPCFLSGWKWPIERDEIFYMKENIIKKINPPIPNNKKGGWQFTDSILKDL